MKTDETVEGNKLIAEFMGWRIYDNGHGRLFFGHIDLFNKEDFCNSQEELVELFNNGNLDAWFIHQDAIEFHSSWDWLMPVVEKIEKTGCIVEIWLCLGKGCRITKGNFKTPIQIISNTESNSTIGAVWLAVVEFIKWYNQRNDKSS